MALNCIYLREKRRYISKRAHNNLPSNLQREKGQGHTCCWCPVQLPWTHRPCQVLPGISTSTFYLRVLFGYVGSKLSRLVIIPKDDGIRWVNILSPLSMPQGGNNPELCYVLSPSISSMANPQKFLIANTIDPESPVDCLPSLLTFPPLSWCF